jgi:hypothetical protein
VVQAEPEQRSDHRTGRVARAVEAERPPPRRIVGLVGDERVARDAAHALADPIDHSPGEHERPHDRRDDDELADRRQRVPGGDPRAPAAPS